jgi:hypothetical protein
MILYTLPIGAANSFQYLDSPKFLSPHSPLVNPFYSVFGKVGRSRLDACCRLDLGYYLSRKNQI